MRRHILHHLVCGLHFLSFLHRKTSATQRDCGLCDHTVKPREVMRRTTRLDLRIPGVSDEQHDQQD